MKGPRTPAPGPIFFRSELLASSLPTGRDDCPNRPCSMLKFKAVGFGPRTPTPGPILFRLRQIVLPLLSPLCGLSERWDLNPYAYY